MTVRVRPVDLDTEQEEVVGVLERNLTELPHARRFKWIYRDNPLGPAWSWLAWNTETRQVVGVASVFRRAMWVGGRTELCGQVGDFAIDPSYRSLGPALMLQRATFEPVDRGDLALCYDCPPHDRGMSTFRRLGIPASATTTRYARLLRTDRQLAKRLGDNWATASLAPVGNALLRLSSRRRSRAAGFEVARHEDRFDEEFSVLDRRVGDGNVVRGRRAAEDLNWRYRDDPLNDYRVFTARRRGELIGFAVMALSGRDAYVVDLFGNLSPDEAAELVDAMTSHLRDTEAESLHALISSHSPLTVPLGHCGFRLRTSGPRVVAHTRAGGKSRAQLEGGMLWVLTYSDVMV